MRVICAESLMTVMRLNLIISRTVWVLTLSLSATSSMVSRLPPVDASTSPGTPLTAGVII